MSSHGTNPNVNSYQGYVEPAPRYRSLKTVSRNPNCTQMVINPNDPSMLNSLVAYESGLLNPNANNPIVLGSEYYTIGLGYGECPKDLYVPRRGVGIVPRTVYGQPPRVLLAKPKAQDIMVHKQQM